MAKQSQKYDWIFIAAVAIVLLTFIPAQIQALGGDNYSILTVTTTVGGLLVNIAASRFEQKGRILPGGSLNPALIGIVTGALLYVILNAIIFVVGLVLVSEEAEFARRQASFVANKGGFGEYVVLSASSVAAVVMSVVAIVAGAALIIRARKHFTATVIASLSYVGIALVVRLVSLIHGDITQFKIFNDIGWGDVLVGLLMNVSIISSMLWLGVVLARGRNASISLAVDSG